MKRKMKMVASEEERGVYEANLELKVVRRILRFLWNEGTGRYSIAMVLGDHLSNQRRSKKVNKGQFKCNLTPLLYEMYKKEEGVGACT